MFGSTEHGRSKRITGNNLVLTGQGQLTGILVANGTPTVKIYDGVDNTGEVIVNSMVCAAATPYPIPRIINTGIYIEVTNAGDITVFYN